MLEFFRQLFSTDVFMPHGMCYNWDPAVLWLNVISDVAIAASYYAIPFLLFYFVRKRRDISFNGIFVAFGMFILACGTTHALAAATVWTPVYRLDGVVKAITAVASAATLFMLIPMMPWLIKIPSPSEMAGVNRRLENEVEERRAAEAEVRKMNSELEDRVEQRTAALAQSESLHRDAANSLREANESLRAEMAQRQSLESQLIQAQKMEAVGRLAGGVAHDFNNLLTAILGYNELLRAEVKQSPEAADYADEVRRAAERASALTHQLLAFSRRQPAAPRVLNLNEVTGQIDKMLRRIIGEDVTLEAKLAPDLWPVKVDPANIDQLIVNLAVNARDAMPNGGAVTIETANVHLTEEYAGRHLNCNPGRYAMLAVSDTGTGMDAHTLAHLFEPFFTTKEQGKGTGLGLSIVYGIVKQSGGDIFVYSEPGAGSVFKIYLPAVDERVESSAADEEPDEGAATGTILLVEDEDQVRSLTRTMLERAGYKVIAAESGAAALQALEESREGVDLLLTDIVMPRMNGLDLAARVSKVRPEAGVLFMSGYTDTGIAQLGLTTPNSKFIEKPFTAAALSRKVREGIRARKAC